MADDFERLLKSPAGHAYKAQVRQALRDRTETLFDQLLGERKPGGNKRQIRYHGATIVEVSGAKRGVWFCHTQGKGGGPFEVIPFIRRCSTTEAWLWAGQWCGISLSPLTEEQAKRYAETASDDRKARQAEAATRRAADEAEKAERIANARRAAKRKRPIEDTTAALYLARRGIFQPPSGWPSCLGYDSYHNALIGEATDAEGVVRAIQRVLLTKDANKVDIEEATRRGFLAVKPTKGVIAGSAMRMAGPDDQPLIINEGFEDGLICHTATEWETWATFGVDNIGNQTLPMGRTIIVAANDDKRGSQADKAVRTAVAAFRRKGHDVRVVYPWPIRRYDKSDFNALAMAKGVQAVRDRLHWAADPLLIVPRPTPLVIARERLRRLIKEWGDKVLKGNGQHGAIETPPGSGKTTYAIEIALAMLLEMMAKGDDRCIVLAVPTMRHAEEKKKLADAIIPGMTAVYRGRTADDPEKPGHKMCGNPGAVNAALAIGVEIVPAACHKLLSDGTISNCALYNSCAHIMQGFQRAKLWIVAHDCLFVHKPSAIGEVAGIICDEAPWQDGIKLREPWRKLGLNLFNSDYHIPDSPTETAWLKDFLGRLNVALTFDADGQIIPDGTIRKSWLWRRDIVSADMVRARKALWRCKVDPGLYPTMTKDEREEASRHAYINHAILKLVPLTHVLEGLLDGPFDGTTTWAIIGTEHHESFGTQRYIQLSRRVPVNEKWRAPTLFLDATLQPELLRPHWPELWQNNSDEIAKLKAEQTVDRAALASAETSNKTTERESLTRKIHKLETAIRVRNAQIEQLSRLEKPRVDRIQIAAPYERITQVTDYSYSFKQLDSSDERASPEEQRCRSRRLTEVRASIVRWLASFNGRKLVVAPLRIQTLLEAMGPIPGVEFAHHNNVAGEDGWKDVRAMVVLGRLTMDPRLAESTAETLTGQPSEHVKGWYHRADGVRILQDGNAIPAETDWHLDPIAEAIRWRTCEGEMVQVVGRPRGINRTELNPVDILIMSDVVLPVVITEAISHTQIEPTAGDMMRSMWGIAFTTAAHAVIAGKSNNRPLWTLRDAASKAGVEEDMEPPPGTQCVKYQMAGKGRREEIAWFDPATVNDVTATIGDLLGTMSGKAEVVDLVYFPHEKYLLEKLYKVGPVDPAEEAPEPPPETQVDEPAPATDLTLPPTLVRHHKTPQWKPWNSPTTQMQMIVAQPEVERARQSRPMGSVGSLILATSTVVRNERRNPHHRLMTRQCGRMR